MRRLGIVVAGIVAMAILPSPALATGGEGDAWPSVNESSGCGASYTRSPHTGEGGWLSTDSLIRGPWGALFGRTVQQVRDDTVLWSVPGSSERLQVHERMIPALEQVEASLLAQMSRGDDYSVNPATTYSFAARTIGGNTRMSRHGIGDAFDINADRNPFRGDNRLITDLPDWWVRAFEEAGFCWGGRWFGRKDTMHFSWMGPMFSGDVSLPSPYAPLTDAVPFGPRAASVPVVPEPLGGTFNSVLADVDPNGAVDVVHVARMGRDIVIDVSRASGAHDACSLSRYVAADASSPDADILASGFGDWDGRGGQDLWLVEDEDGFLRLTVRWRHGSFSAETVAATAVPTPGPDAWISTADYERDGSLDLFVVSGRRLTVWAVDPDTGDTSKVMAADLRIPTSGQVMLGDRDGDERPDLWVLAGETLHIATAASRYRASSADTVLAVPSVVVDAAAADYDGDGRDDLIVYDGDTKHAWLGNTLLSDGKGLEVWFESPEAGCEEGRPTWDELGIRFGVSGRVNHGAVEWWTRWEFDAPCDPTVEDNVHCLPRPTTAGELAAFLAWSLDLPALDDGPEAAANALRVAGIAAPCRSGDVECWQRTISRAESAARFAIALDSRLPETRDPHRWVVANAAVPTATGLTPE